MDTHTFKVTHPETGQEVERVIAAENRAEAAKHLRSIGFILGEDDTLPSEYETPLSSDEAPPSGDEAHPSENQAPPKTIEEAIQRMADDGDAHPEGTARMNYRWLFDPKPTTAEEAVQLMTDEGLFDPEASAKHYWPEFFAGTEPVGEETPPVETDVPEDKPTRKPRKPKA